MSGETMTAANFGAEDYYSASIPPELLATDAPPRPEVQPDEEPEPEEEPDPDTDEVPLVPQQKRRKR